MEIEPNLSHAFNFDPVIKKLQLFHFYCYESGCPLLKVSKKTTTSISKRYIFFLQKAAAVI